MSHLSITFRYYLSIHDLTRRSTRMDESDSQRPHLSIHDLTRRSTLPHILSNSVDPSFNSRPHKEVDFVTFIHAFPLLSFNSRPHKEVDPIVCALLCMWHIFQFTTSQGGRRIRKPERRCRSRLSIHDLTRRST